MRDLRRDVDVVGPIALCFGKSIIFKGWYGRYQD